MRINKLKIERFRCFKNTKIELGLHVNVLVGPNNCGKSSILEAIYMSFQFLASSNGISEWNRKKKKLKGVTLREPLIPIPDLSYLSYNLNKGAQTSNRIEIDVDTDMESFKTWATFSGHNMNVYSGKDIDDRGGEDYRKKIDEIIKKPPTFVPLFSGVTALEEHKTPEVSDYYSKTGKASEILRNKFYELQNNHPEQIEKVKRYIREKFNIEFTDSKVDNLGIYVRTHYVENGKHPKKDEDFDISALGSGFQQILHLLLYIFYKDTDIILIDEPDAHLHRDMQKVLFDLLSEVAEKESKQIIIATHSFEFIKLATKEEPVKLFLIDKNEEEQKPISDYCEFLRDLYSNGLISERDLKENSTKFFVCEDETDGKRIIEALLFKYKPEWEVKGFPFIFLSGKGTENENILSSLKIRSKEDTNTKGIILNDSDGLSENRSFKIESSKSSESIKWKYIPFFEMENILLDTAIIKRAIDEKNKTGNQDLFSVEETWIRDKLEAIMDIEEIKSHLRTNIGKKIQKYHRELDEDYGNYQDIAEERFRSIISMDFDNKTKNMPGKQILGKLLSELQEEKSINICYKDIVRVFEKEEIPEFLKKIIKDFII
ncbi:AAA family ATPase [bacterium]|nr:AAA family ATPase [bacterium]